MTSSVSIGDAILLSQIAYKIGRALSSGRKSAPSEFLETQDLLNTLENVLKLVARELPKQDVSAEPDDQEESKGKLSENDTILLSDMLQGCHRTLSHLEAIVVKYEVIDPKYSESTKSERVQDEVKMSWKMIIWTKEGGDIIKLKTTLTAHINGLTLAVGALGMSHSKSANEKITHIYDWFLANIIVENKTKKGSTPLQEKTDSNFTTRVTFTVSTQMSGMSTVLCPTATFGDVWSGRSINTLHSDALTQVEDPIQPKSFEDYATLLAQSQALLHAQQGFNTHLISSNSHETRILSAKAQPTRDSDLLTELITSITFVSSGTRFSLTNIERIQLLHYKSFDLNQTSGNTPLFLAHPDAELIIECSNHPDSETYHVLLTKDMSITTETNHISLSATTCHSLTTTLNCAVELGFSSHTFPSSGFQLQRLLHTVQHHLLRSYLQNPLVSEQILFTRPVGTVLLSDMLLAAATTSTIVEQSTGKHRIVLQNWDGSASVTLELDEQILGAGEQIAWFVKEGNDGVAIWQGAMGFGFMGGAGKGDDVLQRRLTDRFIQEGDEVVGTKEVE
ncbi:hypothetical protein BT63DRAFT_437485 [Microthyrium microscopicum]|uniref:NACHT-NTPase and P-loop NTPases N-terminal domain-containing protein n=1 Tax=Microthyrium microscopicum TaxID=703497 RepID=A0A6A6UQ88_9PEZI|nr:hypothetical protein BT63DRAFT_437485 [Microthyrium microscopicum]